MEKHVFRMGDNWHAHLRQDGLLELVRDYFNIYGRVLCMGNTSPMIETAEDALLYQKKISEGGATFSPEVCIMLTNDTTPQTVYEAKEKGIRFVKFIPRGTSTGASKGLNIINFVELYKIFGAIQETGMYLLIHAEKAYAGATNIPYLQREEIAIDAIDIYRKRFPGMKITIEHASMKSTIDYVLYSESPNLRATLAPQHALLTYCDVFNSDEKIINPYNFCLPVLKPKLDRRAVCEAMTSGDERFFAGSDAAPHLETQKEGKTPPAGIFFGSTEYLRWFQVFEKMGRIDKFEDFTSRFGAEYYGYPLNGGTIAIQKEEWLPPLRKNGIRFTMGGEPLAWKIVEVNGEKVY